MSEDNVSKLWRLYEYGQQYQKQLGISNQIPLNIDFFEGRQWGNVELATNTDNLPRPTINITKLICRNKKAAVLSSPVKLEFRSNLDNTENNYSSRFTRFSEYIQKELRQADLDNDAIDDAVKKGTYIYHYYWDASAEGILGRYEGGVRAEIIDPLRVFFANPNERDVQKQKWIMIVSRIEVKAAKELADKNVDKSLIIADEPEFENYSELEQEGENMCTVLTRYFKVDGEVYYETATKNVILHEPISINPYAQDVDSIGGDEDDENAEDDDRPDSGENGIGNKPKAQTAEHIRATLYPIAVGVWEKREGSIYGLSEVEDLIPNQKAINRTEAVKQLIGQSQAAGKIVVKDGALKNQTITNSPLQVITDHSNPGERGFYTLDVGQVSPIIATVTNDLINNTRMVSGATEVLSGEIISKNMSGAAIAQLQAQAAKPIQEFQLRFFRVREQTGLILSQFFKLYYENKQYYYYDNDEKQTKTDVFNGEEYEKQLITVTCEAGAGSVFSDSMTISILGELLAKDIIDAKTYINAFPSGAMPNKQEILQAIEKNEQSEINQLKQQLQQLMQQNEGYKQKVMNDQKVIENADTIVQERNRIGELLIQLQAEYSQKINSGNQKYKEVLDVLRQMQMRAAS